MGLVDKIIRICLAAIVVILYVTGVIRGTVAIVLGILAAVFLVTSVVGTCPLYLPFKIDTRGKKKA
jgi:K+-transporting ATPase A subunit